MMMSVCLAQTTVMVMPIALIQKAVSHVNVARDSMVMVRLVRVRINDVLLSLNNIKVRNIVLVLIF